MRRLFGIIFALVALAGMSLGFFALYDTEIRLMNSVPVTTVIRDKSVDPVKGINGQYFARANYRYVVDDNFYVGNKVFVYDFHSPMADYLLKVIEPLEIGAPRVAYYNKYNPQDSFLIKSIPYPPYVAILASLVIFTAGLYLIMTPGFGQKEPRKLSSGWFEMKSVNASMIEIEKASLAQAIIFSVIGFFTFANYFIHSPDSTGVWEISAVCIFVLLGSHYWQQAMAARKRASLYGEVHLELASPSLDVDKDYQAKIRQRLRRDAKIISCDLGVVGHKSTIYGPVASDIWYHNVVDKNVNAKSDFKLEQTFKLPSKSEGDAFCLVVRIKNDTGIQEWNFPVRVNRINEPR